jgi:hypothetical protein
MKYYIILVLIIILFAIFYILNNINNNFEHFCKIESIDSQGGINDKRVLLDYPPQSNISTSSCDQYWKKWPLESNNLLVQDNPIPIKSDQLTLPKEKQFGNNNYTAGLLDFNKLANIVNDDFKEDIFSISKELLIDPLTKKKLNYMYELEFSYVELNKKTWINRWKFYNPSIKKIFNYEDIKSPIEELNKLNLEFKKRCDILQKNLLTKEQLVLFGLINFEIFKYRIINVNYLNNDIENPIYIIEICFFRDTVLYMNTFSYVGFFKDNKIMIINTKYIGRNSTDHMLLADYYNPNELKQEIINKNFSNSPIIEKNPDAISKITKDYENSFKIKNQYACFNLNYDASAKNQYILPYYSRESCESNYDFYGKQKDVGIYDTPCKNDSECPFFKINKNYENNFGKCMENGNCELPLNVKKVGYRYFLTNDESYPLCYNCNSSTYNLSKNLDNCCKEQNNKEKYDYLKSPDYAFEDDYNVRKNYLYNKNCHVKPNSSDIIC